MARRLRVVLHRSVTCLECLSSSLTKQRNTDQRRDELLLSLLRTSWPPIEPVGALYDALRDNDIVAETRTDTVARAIRDYVSHSNGAFQVRRSLRTHLASADVARSPRSPPPSAASCCASLTSTRSTSSRFSTSRPRLTQSCTSPTRTPRWPPDCPLSVSLKPGSLPSVPLLWISSASPTTPARRSCARRGSCACTIPSSSPTRP